MKLDRDTQRFPGTTSVGTLPTYKDVDSLLYQKDDTFIDFTERLRNLNNEIHVWTGGQGVGKDGQTTSGDMGLIPFSSFDPIYWSHKCMVDRIWWQWQHENGIDNMPNEWKDIVLEPFSMKVSDVLDISNLGYNYSEETDSS